MQKQFKANFFIRLIPDSRNWLVFLFLFILSFDFLYSQVPPEEIARLKEEVAHTEDDKKKAKLYYQLANGYRFSVIDSGLHYANKCAELSKKINEHVLQVDALSIIGFILLEEGDIAGSLKYQLEGLKILEEHPDPSALGRHYNRVGNVYMELEEYPLSLENYDRSIQYHYQANDPGLAHNGLSNIGNIYELMGELDSARVYHNKVFEFSKTNTDRDDITYGEMRVRMGNLEASSGNYDEALYQYHEGRKESLIDNDIRNLTFSYLQMAKVFYQVNELDSSRFYAQKGLKTAGKIRFKKAIFEASDLLANYYKQEDKLDSSLYYLEQANTYKDSLFGAETFRQLQLINLNEQKRQQELIQENQELRAFYQRVIFLFLLALAGIIAVYLWINNKKKEKRNALLKSQKDEIEKSHLELSAEKKKSDDLLLNILPAEIAEELKENGSAEAKSINSVSVLFSDFKGFTEASTQMTAHELVAEINTCFAAFDSIMTKYGIEKIKTIGDAYMAAGGLPVPENDSVKNTVLAALEMQSFISQRAKEMTLDGSPFFEMRLGINTGPVVAGIVGVKKFQYDIWGDTVNTASRLESNGLPGKVNISQSTYEILKDDSDFIFENRGKVNVKGKGEIDMWFVSKP